MQNQNQFLIFKNSKDKLPRLIARNVQYVDARFFPICSNLYRRDIRSAVKGKTGNKCIIV